MRFLDLAFEPIMVRSFKGEITYWNKGADELYGYSSEEALGFGSHELLKTEFPIPLADIEKQLKEEGSWLGKLIHTSKNGKKIIVESRHQLFDLGNGKQLVLETNRDITKRETQYRTLFEGMQEGAGFCQMIFDGQGQPVDWIYLDVNSALEDLLGLGKIIGKHVSELFPGLKEANPEVFESYGRVTKTGVPEKIETYVRPLNKWIYVSAFSPYPNHFIAILKDITERKRSEESLNHRHNQLKSFVEHLPASVAMLDRDLRYLSYSHRWLEEYKLGEQDLTGRHHYDVFPEIRNMPEWQAVHQRALSGEVIKNDEDHFVRSDGSEQWQRWEVRPWLDVEGEIGGILIFSEDITDRKRAHEALRASEDRLRRVSDNANVGLTRCSRDWYYLSANPAYAEIAGKPIDQIVGRPIVEVMGAEAVETIRPYVERVLRGEQVTYEAAVPFSGAGQRYLHVSYTPDTDARNQIVGWVACVTDITASRQAEVELRESEARYRTLFDSIDEGYCVVRVMFDDAGKARDYVFEEVNPAFERQTGIQNPVGRFMREIAPEHEEHWFETYGRIAKTGQPERFQNIASQLHRWYDVYAFRIGDPQEHRVAILFNDITEHKQAEMALLQSEEKLKLVLDSAEMGIWDWNVTSDQLKWDEQQCRLFGISAEQFSGNIHQALERIHPDDLEGVKVAITLALEEDQPIRTEYRVIHPDGSTHWLFAIGQLVSKPLASGKRMMGVCFEITERKQAEIERDQYTRLENMAQVHRLHIAGEFAALLAHQLNQPLTAIRSFAEAGLARLRRGNLEPGQMRETLEEVVGQSERAAGSIRDLRKFLARQPMEMIEGDINAEVKAACSLMDVLARGRKVKITAKLATDLPNIPMRTSQIEQIIINLIENAMDAINHSVANEGSIEISTHLDENNGEVVVGIQDSGPGLDEKTVSLVFDPLYTTKKNGIGMGLAISRSIIADHEGRIWAEPGPGGRFFFTLPVQK